MSNIKKKCENCRWFRPYFNYEGAGCSLYDVNLPNDYAENSCKKDLINRHSV